MKLIGVVLAPALWIGSAVQADLRPEKLSDFLLDRSPLLRGFLKVSSHHLPPLHDKPSEAVATLNVRYFHGSSELAYTVLLFRDKKAFSDWDRQMRSSAPGWSSPLRSKPVSGLRESRLGGPIRPNLPTGRAFLVGDRLLIMAGGWQHEEMIRRDPKQAAHALSDQELTKRIIGVRAELIRRARQALSAGIDPVI